MGAGLWLLFSPGRNGCGHRLARDPVSWEAAGTRPFEHYDRGGPLPLSYEFYREAGRHPVRPPVRCPALILAGRHDATVPLAAIEPFAGEGADRTLIVLEDDHRLSADLPGLWRHIDGFLTARGWLGKIAYQ